MKAQQSVKLTVEIAHPACGLLGGKSVTLVTCGTPLPFNYEERFWDDWIRADALACISVYIDKEEVYAESRQVPRNVLEEAAEAAWGLTGAIIGAEARKYQKEATCQLSIDNNGAGKLKVLVGVGGNDHPKAVFSTTFFIKTSQ